LCLTESRFSVAGMRNKKKKPLSSEAQFEAPAGILLEKRRIGRIVPRGVSVGGEQEYIYGQGWMQPRGV